MLKVVENKETLTNIDIEMTLVSCAIIHQNLWTKCNFVKPDDFVDTLAARVWEEIGTFIISGRKPDVRLLSLSIYNNHEDQKKCSDFLSNWTGNIVTAFNAEDYAQIVKDLADRRRLVAGAQEIIGMARNTANGLSASEIAARGVREIISPNINDDLVSAYSIGEEIIRDLKRPLECYPTGFPLFDNALGGGFYKNKFYGISGRMKAGKSMFMTSVAYKMACLGKARILYLCLEMGSKESMQRILSMHMGVNSSHFLRPSICNSPWFEKNTTEANMAMKIANLYFRYRPNMTLDDLKATMARAALSEKIDGIIVDYMQLVGGQEKGQSKSEHYDNVAQSIAECVKRYPIWILSAAQLNREGNVRGSDGLLMACDMAFALNKKDGDVLPDGFKNHDMAWIETMVSRYMPYKSIGSEKAPGYEIDAGRGPIFVEL